MTIRAGFAFALLVSLCTPTFAQQAVVATFTPDPAPQGVNVQMAYTLPRPGCGSAIATTVTRNGTAIRVDYVLGELPGSICLGTPPPFTPVVLDLGGYPPGLYSVSAFGTDQVYQGAVPVVSGTFGVVASSSVPAISSALAALLGTLAAFAGAVVLRRRTSR